jgi:hypothetical protein
MEFHPTRIHARDKHRVNIYMRRRPHAEYTDWERYLHRCVFSWHPAIHTQGHEGAQYCKLVSVLITAGFVRHGRFRVCWLLGVCHVSLGYYRLSESVSGFVLMVCLS